MDSPLWEENLCWLILVLFNPCLAYHKMGIGKQWRHRSDAAVLVLRPGFALKPGFSLIDDIGKKNRSDPFNREWFYIGTELLIAMFVRKFNCYFTHCRRQMWQLSLLSPCFCIWYDKLHKPLQVSDKQMTYCLPVENRSLEYAQRE